MTATTTQEKRSEPPEAVIDAEATSATATDEPNSAGLSLDLAFESLKNSRRRQVLRYLQDTGSASVGELAEHVAAIENDTTVQALSSQQRKRVYVGLYQCHLPKLDDKDVVDYDDDRGTVSLGPNAGKLSEYLAVADGDRRGTDRPWHRYYAGVAGTAAVVLALAVFVGGPALGTVATLTSVGLFLGVAGLALAQRQELA